MKTEKTSKEFILDILRRAFITRKDALVIYDMMRDEFIEALAEGKEINLFELAAIRPHTTPAHVRNSFNGMINVPERTNLKARIFPRLRREWDDIND